MTTPTPPQDGKLLSLERITEVSARNGDHVSMAFVVRDEMGATHFRFRLDKNPLMIGFDRGWISCAGVETHFSKCPEYMNGRPPSHTDCPYTLTGICWHDGTSLWASEHWVPGFEFGGTDWIWSELEYQHRKRFHESEAAS